MNIVDIITDSLAYPFQNIMAFIVYAILGIIAWVAVGGTIVGIVLGTKVNQTLTTGIIAVIGIILAIIIALLISGYELDIVKLGTMRSYESPEIDFVRQVHNGINLVITKLVYYLIPFIITLVLSLVLGLFLRNWIVSIIAFIIYVIFAFAEYMAECRLAKTEELSEALAVGEAINDITRVGVINVVSVTLILLVISFIISLIIFYLMSFGGAIGLLGSILLGIFAVYFEFVTGRAKGLLYSNA